MVIILNLKNRKCVCKKNLNLRSVNNLSSHKDDTCYHIFTFSVLERMALHYRIPTSLVSKDI